MSDDDPFCRRDSEASPRSYVLSIAMAGPIGIKRSWSAQTTAYDALAVVVAALVVLMVVACSGGLG